jgi:hypothetical protein
MPDGWKTALAHPFESPFVSDPPEAAAARYRAWLTAQPGFRHFVCTQLKGARLHGNTAHDLAHARGLAVLVSEYL